MKKIIALLLIAASILSFAACKGDEGEVNTNPEEIANDFAENQAKVEAEYSKQAAEKAAEESKIQEEIDEYIEEVGKTKKKTQLVIEVASSLGREYIKYEYNKKGEYKTKKVYYFYDTLENYNACLEAEKNADDVKIIDKNKDTRMFVAEYKKFNGQSFDEMYEIYSKESIKDKGYKIVE